MNMREEARVTLQCDRIPLLENKSLLVAYGNSIKKSSAARCNMTVYLYVSTFRWD